MSNQETLKKKSNVFNIIYFVFFLFLPFIYSEEVIDPILIPRQLYLSLFLLIIGFVIIIQLINKKTIPDLSFLKTTLPLVFCVFILISIISAINATAISESLYVISKTTIEISFFAITTYLILQKKIELEALIKAIVLFSTSSIFLACYQTYSLFFSDEDFFNNMNLISATFANKNLLSSILFLTLPFVCSGFFLNKEWKNIATVSSFLILLLLLIIQTRTVLIAILFSFLIYLTLIFKNRVFSTSYKKIIITSVISLSIILGSFLYFKQEKYFSRLTNTNTAHIRTLLWENSLSIAKDHPFLGVGSGNWQIHFPKYGMNKFDEYSIKNGMITYQRPHNDFLWVLSENGIIGLSIYLLIFISSLFYLWRLMNFQTDSKIKKTYALFFSGIIGYMIISFADFPLERIEHQVILLLIFSFTTAHYFEAFKNSKKETTNFPSFSIFILLFFITVFLSLIVSLKRYSGESHTRIMKNFHHKSNWTQMIKEADRAINFCYQIDPMSAPLEWYKGVALFSLGNYELALTSFEKANEIHPNNMHILNNLGTCYELNKEHKKAEAFYLKALSISSEFDEARLNLAAVYFNNGNNEMAFNTIDKINTDCPDAKYKVFLMAILKLKINDLLKSKSNDSNLVEKIRGISDSDEKLLNLFFESKRKNIKFVYYVFFIWNKQTLVDSQRTENQKFNF